MSRARVAGWTLLVSLSVFLASCGTDKTEQTKNIPVNLRPLAAKKSVVPGNRELSQYTHVLEKLEAFVAHGRREIRSMGELPRQAAADPGLYATQIGMWEETGSEWNDDLIVIEGELPERPAREENTSLHLVHSNLTRAIQELRRIPFRISGGRAPTLQEREDRLAAAEDYLRRARQTLEDGRG